MGKSVGSVVGGVVGSVDKANGDGNRVNILSSLQIIRPTQPQSQSSARDPRDSTVVGQQRTGKFSHSGRVTGKISTCITDDLLCVHSCKTCSAYTGHVVNCKIARAASLVFIII